MILIAILFPAIYFFLKEKFVSAIVAFLLQVSAFFLFPLIYVFLISLSISIWAVIFYIQENAEKRNEKLIKAIKGDRIEGDVPNMSDNFISGLVIGFFAPFFGFILYKYIKYRAFTFGEMLQWLKLNPNLITAFISVSLFANAALFTIFINTNRDKTAKGIFVLTIIYAVIAMLFKYL